MTQEPNIFPYIARLLQGAEVVWKPLGEVFDIIAGGDVPKEALSETLTNEYNIPILSNGINEKAIYGWTNIPKIDKPSLTISARGTIGWTSYRDRPFFPIVRLLVLTPLIEINLKYAYHFMKSIENNYKVPKVGIPQLTKPMIKDIPIPLPPLSVQQEIVRILDKCTQLGAELEAELEAELDCRKRQYEYYRNKLLTYEGNEIVWKTLGEVGSFIRGNGLQKKDFVETGIGCIHYGQIYTYYGIKASETISYVTEDLAKSLRKASHNDLIIAGVSENIEDVCKCVVWEGEEDICVSGDTFIFKTDQNPHYIGHLLRTDNFLNYKRKNAIGAKVTRLQTGSLPKYTIPLPPLEEQQRIANILDKFNTLVNSISEGLPKEIALRRKQYEYYRERLLSF